MLNWVAYLLYAHVRLFSCATDTCEYERGVYCSNDMQRAGCFEDFCEQDRFDRAMPRQSARECLDDMAMLKCLRDGTCSLPAIL